jgi:hypothetical protein
VEDRPGRAQGDFVAVAQGAFACDAFSVDEGAVQTAQILQDVLVALLDDDAMFLRDDLVEELDTVTGMPPQRVAGGEGHRLLTLWSRQHQTRHQPCRLLATVANDKRCDI